MRKLIRRALPIAALLIAALPATAQSKETLTVDGDKVDILRDKYGVPHVFATTLRGLLFGDGYAVAQDRLAQMEFYRHDARGEMAEIVGAKAFQADKEARISGYSEEERQKIFSEMTPEERMMIQGYADGVNAWREKAIAESKIPKRLAEIGDVPAPWRVTDCIAVGQMMAQRFGGAFRKGSELANMQIVQYLKQRHGVKIAWLLLNDLMWRNDKNAPVTLPDSESPKHYAGPPSHPLNADNAKLLFGDAALSDAETIERARSVMEMDARHELAAKYDLPTKLGSYAVAVMGQKSATGNALLIGGPQMGFGTSPQIAHEIALSGAGIDSIGLGFAGAPGVLIGHNRNVAWSFTSGIGDLADTFIEKLNPSNPEQYWFKGQWRDMEKRVETIKVKDGETVSLTVYRTVHGAIMQTDAKNNRAYSLQAGYWMREMKMFSALNAVNQAKTAQDALEAAKILPTSFNILCADRKGDIGYRYCGRLPIRDERISPLIPTPGTGEYEWKGFFAPDDLPHGMNPKKGFFVNWNTKPASWWNNGEIPVWGALWRSSHEEDVLNAKNNLTTDDLRNLVMNEIAVFDVGAEYFVPKLLDASKRHASQIGATEREALARLAAWDRRANENSVAKTICDAWLQQLREDLFLKVYGSLNPLAANDFTFFNLAMQTSFMLHVLAGKDSPVPVRYDFLKGRTPDDILFGALRKALVKLAAERGPIMATWRFNHGRHALGSLEGIPEYDRGSYIQILECSKPIVTGANILAPGQSEDPESPHFSDQRELAGWWFFKPMLTEREDIEKSK